MIVLGTSLRAKKEGEDLEGQMQKPRTMKMSRKESFTTSTMKADHVVLIYLQLLSEGVHLIPTSETIIPRNRVIGKTWETRIAMPQGLLADIKKHLSSLQIIRVLVVAHRRFSARATVFHIFVTLVRQRLFLVSNKWLYL